MEAMQAQLDKERQKMREENEKLSEELADKDMELASLETEKVELEIRFERERKELEEERRRAEEWKAHQSLVEQKIHKLHEKVKEEQAKHQEMKKKLKAFESVKMDPIDASARDSAAQDAYEELQQQYAQLKAKCEQDASSLEEQNERMEELQEKNEELDAILTEMENQTASMMDQLTNSMERKISREKRKKEDALESLKESEDKRAAVEVELAGLRPLATQVGTLQGEVDQLQTQLDQESKGRTAAEEKAASLETELADAKVNANKSLAAVRQQLSAASGASDAASDQIKQLQAELSAAVQESATLLKKAADNQKAKDEEAKQLKGEIKTLQDSIRKLQTEAAQDYADKQAAASEALSKQKHLETKVRKAEQWAQDLQDELNDIKQKATRDKHANKFRAATSLLVSSKRKQAADTALQSVKSEATFALDSLQQELSDTQAQLKSELDIAGKLQEANTDAQKKLSDLEDTNKDLKNQLAAAAARDAQLKTALQQAAQGSADAAQALSKRLAQEKIAAQMRMGAAAARLTDTVDELKVQYADMLLEKDALQVRAAQLAQAQKDQKRQLQSESEAALAALAAKHEAELKAQREQYEDAANDITDATQLTAAVHKKELNRLNEEHCTIMRDLEAKHAKELRELKVSGGAATRWQLAGLGTKLGLELQSKEQQLKSLQQQKEELDARHAEEMAHLTREHECALGVLRQQGSSTTDELQQQLESAEKAKNQLQAQHDMEEAELKRRGDRIAALEVELSQSSSEASALRSQLQSQKGVASELQDHIKREKQLERQLTELDVKFKAQLDAVSKLSATLATHVEHEEELEQQIHVEHAHAVDAEQRLAALQDQMAERGHSDEELQRMSLAVKLEMDRTNAARQELLRTKARLSAAQDKLQLVDGTDAEALEKERQKLTWEMQRAIRLEGRLKEVQQELARWKARALKSEQHAAAPPGSPVVPSLNMPRAGPQCSEPSRAATAREYHTSSQPEGNILPPATARTAAAKHEFVFREGRWAKEHDWRGHYAREIDELAQRSDLRRPNPAGGYASRHVLTPRDMCTSLQRSAAVEHESMMAWERRARQSGIHSQRLDDYRVMTYQDQRLAADVAWDRYLEVHSQSSGSLADLRNRLLQTRLDIAL